MSSQQAWSTFSVPSQLEQHSETLFQREKKKKVFLPVTPQMIVDVLFVFWLIDLSSPISGNSWGKGRWFSLLSRAGSDG